MSEFKDLLAALNAAEETETALAKALPTENETDDEEIVAAAAEGDETEAADETDEDDKPAMAKSMTAKTESGEEVELVDAEALIKSLGDLTERVGGFESVLAKGLSSALNTITAQGQMLKALTAKVEKLSGQGAGRKTVLAVHEKPAVTDMLAKSQPQEGITNQEFFAKANAKFDEKKLSGSDLTIISVSLRENQPIDPALISKVLS